MSYPGRSFSNGSYYHVFNKTIDGKTPFLNSNLCNAFLDTTHYYRASDLTLSFSKWKRLKTIEKDKTKIFLNNPRNFRVTIHAYCLMPNHFHFVLKQVAPNGVHDFISNLSNSFTRAFNIQHKRKGPLFLERFHAVPISSVEQLLIVCRYVHLNPIANKTDNINGAFHEYPWSSYRDYINPQPNSRLLTLIDPVLKYFNNDSALYQQYVESEFY